MEWNLYGKVKKVTRTTGSKPDLEFYYDAAGRRILKIAKPHNALTDKTQWKYTVFVYDAGGQLMSEYELFYFIGGYYLMQNGRYMYGSGKLGKTRDRFSVTPNPPPSSYTPVDSCTACAAASVGASQPDPNTGQTIKAYNRTLGFKQYEFTNHLGNVLVTLNDRRLSVDDGTYTYSAGTLTRTSAASDGRLDYYLPDVLTSTDYYPGGMPLPGRTFEGSTCTTVSTPVVNTVRNDAFASGTAAYTAFNGATLSNAAGTLKITKLSTATGSWGTRTPAMALTAGVTYNLSFAIAPGTCSAGKVTNGWRILDASLNEVASGIVLSSTTVVTAFTPGTTGNYYLEFYRNNTTTGACEFTVDNVSVTYTTYTHSTTCTAGTADQYLWGHNGQFKDNELYGNGMAYTAEY